jgi:PadR family transcriptional regulator PadR
VLELCILALLQDGPAYVSDLLERLKQSKIIVVEGTLYPLLTRLKNAGVLTYKWEESKSGPPRKYYQLTDLGRKSYEELRGSWNELVQSVEQTLQSTAS